MSKVNKFQYKLLFGPKYAYCETKTWSLVCIGDKGMFYSLSRIFDTKKHNGFKTWNNAANIRCPSDTVERHFESEMDKDAYEASQRRENSYFDREEEKKVTMLKNEIYFKSVVKIKRSNVCRLLTDEVTDIYVYT